MITKTLCILGRQPSIGIAELESLYGDHQVHPAGDQAVIVDVDPCSFAFHRLGGSIKFCKVLTTINTTEWGKVEEFLEKNAPEHAKSIPEGKMQLGLSLYGISVTTQRIMATGLKLKKVIRSSGRSVRLVPNKTLDLNSAQVIHNHLTDTNGWELIFVKDKDKIICAQTIQVQDIEAYTVRDRGRPKRDAKVGMLPPKLAQIIINLATGPVPDEQLDINCLPDSNDSLRSSLPILDQKKAILDPFCGSGVILQEAQLMGYSVIGTDLDPRMVNYSRTNLAWLKTIYPKLTQEVSLEIADATNYLWRTPFDYVAAEIYLGQAFNTLPSRDKLDQIKATCNLILERFLVNLSKQISPGQRMCLAVPAWHVAPNRFIHLPVIDQMSNLGYNRLSFKNISNEDLLYYRPDQVVGRELLVIQRK